jgi:hypothetical protein
LAKANGNEFLPHLTQIIPLAEANGNGSLPRLTQIIPLG